ncbi:Cytosolic Fe-S cluster assembly factor nar1 [Sorochytrium milnesiophthora]
MSFSGGLILSDLNDYIAPSQACIKPVEIAKSSDKTGEIRLDDAGQYYEVSREGDETKLETAAITLNDCLACSGCITSAESVLVSMQSHEELVRIAADNARHLAEGQLDLVKTVIVSLSPQSIVSLAATHGLSPLQTARKLTALFQEQYGASLVLDTAFTRDLSLLESADEFVRRYQAHAEAPQQEQDIAPSRVRVRGRRRLGAEDAPDLMSTHLPMLTSACPGWICYAEKTHSYLLPLISTTKSPQQVAGSLVKDYLAKQLGKLPDQIYHVAVMPCYDKKLEASRSDFYSDVYRTRDVDCVITTREVEKLLTATSLPALPEAALDSRFFKHTDTTLLSAAGSSSGGYLEYVLVRAAQELFGMEVGGGGGELSRASAALLAGDAEVQDCGSGLTVQTVRNTDYKEYILRRGAEGPELLRFASVYGFKNIQNFVRKVKTGRAAYHFVEVMACPGGCINGGGQMPPPTTMTAKEWTMHTEQVYRSQPSVDPEHNSVVQQLYSLRPLAMMADNALADSSMKNGSSEQAVTVDMGGSGGADNGAAASETGELSQSKFDDMSSKIVSKIDLMGARLDELEKSLGDLMHQSSGNNEHGQDSTDNV